MPTGHRRRARCLTVFLALGLLLSACASSGRGKVRSEPGGGTGSITIWAHEGQDSENRALRRAVEAFNASQSDVKADLELIPGEDYTEMVARTDVSDLPDVLEFDGPTLANFVHSQKLAPLSWYVSVSTVANATKAVQLQGTVGHQLYGLAMYDSGLGIYGNRKILDAAGVAYPTTLEDAWSAGDFTRALEDLAADDADGKVLDLREASGLATEWGTYGFSPILWSAGGGLLDGSGKASGALDSASVVAAFKTFQSWKPYATPDPDAFARGGAALSWAGHWMYPAFHKALGDDLVVMPLPDFGNGPKTGQGSWSWGIGAATKNGRAAGKFLDFLLNDENVTAMTEANGAPPATVTGLDKSRLYGGKGPLRLFSEQLSAPCGSVITYVDTSCVATTRPAVVGYPVVTREFGKALEAIHTGTEPGIALAGAARAIDRALAEQDQTDR
ncbi:extracellular solute-binding protein [Streptomyces sp. TRM49041]|uniref:sugar ABC transporter substrate-binding protein n=1 Tax=Streptomyces sp. TRM49041 TaxID=2603216 RepID=UPI0011EFBB46|nr:extracellular solute-binding protein [Streptomyces sp. TRM49041]